MTTLSEMIVSWWLFIALQFLFDYIAQYNDGAKREGVPKNCSI